MAFSARAQVIDTIPKIDGNYEYQGVVTLDSSYKKEDLFRSSKVYFVDSYKSANDVIQYQDQTEGKVIGKGFFELNQSKTFTNVKWDVYYSTSIECKNGKYRYRIYDITIKQDWYGSSEHVTKDLNIDDAITEINKGQLKKQALNMYNEMIGNFKNIPVAIKKYMLKSKKESKNDF